jgi:hypothetical protein
VDAKFVQASQQTRRQNSGAAVAPGGAAAGEISRLEDLNVER